MPSYARCFGGSPTSWILYLASCILNSLAPLNRLTRPYAHAIEKIPEFADLVFPLGVEVMSLGEIVPQII